MKNPINKKVRIAFNVLSGIMLVVLMLMVGVILFQRIATGEPRVFGYQFYVILTDSMSPELVPGDVILSKEVT
ncbi:MAG TPA: hypothetical protein PK245_07070, partial [Clostridia bacterium]|nr:hypothetical protein [Clostridia bacterium]